MTKFNILTQSGIAALVPGQPELAVGPLAPAVIGQGRVLPGPCLFVDRAVVHAARLPLHVSPSCSCCSIRITMPAPHSPLRVDRSWRDSWHPPRLASRTAR